MMSEWNCRFCLDTFAARSQRQLDIRRVNMASAPDVKVHPCPKCGGTDWATTKEMVKPELQSWWKRRFTK